MNNISKIDLNLLVTLHTLLNEKNVTRAAQQLNLSQPSVSIQLAKLRQIFADPLLLPGPRGMQPTIRALELQLPLQQALASLQQAIAPVNFDPALTRETWRVAASDYSALTILQPILKTLRQQAPFSRLAIVEVIPAELAKQSENGLIDIAFYIPENLAGDLRQKIIFHENYVLVGRKDHPGLPDSLTLEKFLQLEFVIASPDGGGFSAITDQVLANMGLKRQVVLSVNHFSFIASTVANSDMVAMLPSRLAVGDPRLKIVKAPIEVPGFDVTLLWHERTHRSASHQWLRQLIIAASQ